MCLKDHNGLTEKEFLANYYLEKYPRPAVTADILIFTVNDNKLEILLIKRGGHPYLGQWALPGGFAQEGESLEETAARELYEETGITNLHLKQIGTFSEPKRDPRGWVITAAYMAVVNKKEVNIKAGDDAAAVKWFTIKGERQGNNSKIELVADNIKLEAAAEMQDEENIWENQYKIRLLSSQGIAFDHGKIIFSGLSRLRDKGQV